MLRWGIASCGQISNSFCSALNMAKNNHKIVAVGARDISRAEKFAQIHEIDQAYGSYDQLARDPNVDIVYVGSIHETHYKISQLMLNHDKHVLCEKPMTLSYTDTLELTKLAKQRKRFLMEGVWSRCTLVYDRLRQELRRGSIGEVHSLVATFCVPLIPDRLQRNEEAGSMMLLIGVYLLQLASLVFGNNPSSAQFVGHSTESGTDDYMSVVLQYNGGTQVAHMICDGRYGAPENNALISGSNGTITVCSPFWSPLSLVSPGGRYDYPLPGGPHSPHSPPPPPGVEGIDLLPPPRVNYGNRGNLLHEAEHVRRCIRDGLLESPLVHHSDSLHVAAMVDHALTAVGVSSHC